MYALQTQIRKLQQKEILPAVATYMFSFHLHVRIYIYALQIYLHKPIFKYTKYKQKYRTCAQCF